MRRKYDRDRETGIPIVGRVAEVSERYGVAMSDVALAWHWGKGVAAPIVGCSRPSRVDDAVRALDLKLSDDDVAYLEELYVPHELVGPLARPGDKPLPGAAVRR
ncbi:aldo/keto reductase [Actinobaculum sp. 313]|uniref:aldo/keto reductase n=1 Tax=Actinobaculum sp. 313 TaxID=2495645 RepID=UPI00320474C6